jgi:hypothetical protein
LLKNLHKGESYMAKTLLEEALADAKLLKQTAIENAKNVLVEAISPKIKQFVESQLDECDMGDGADDKLNKMGLGMADEVAGMYEKQDQDECGDKEDMLGQMGLKNLGLGDDSIEEADQEDEEEEDPCADKEDEEEEQEDMEEANMNQFEVADVTEAKEKDDEEEVKEETLDVTNEDLKAALSEVLSSFRLKEASVTKGFGDVEDATIKASGGPGAKGLADEKSGEHMFSNVTAPAAKDMTVKEAFRAVARENAKLKKENAEYKQVCHVLKKSLQEVNLFNSKLLFTQKLLNLSELNNKQRLAVIETFDRATNMREVELVYRSLSESLKIAGVLGESKQVKANKAKASRFTTPSSTILRESVVREEADRSGDNDFSSRMQKLAGLID